MDKEIAQAIGLLRHKIISPVLMDSGRSQMKYFRSLENQVFDVPGRGKRTFKATTMKSWLNNYKKNGFSAITPSARSDNGGFRKISPQMQAQLLERRKEHPDLSVVRFHRMCKEEGILGEKPLCLATVRRFLKLNDMAKPKSVDARKRFEMGTFGELWTGDYMHGPQVNAGQSKRKAILFAVIDDHSRLIVGSQFGVHENTMAIENVLKNSILAYGLPDRIYLDNGPSFSSNYLAKVCANLGIGLVHSKPYDSPSRGKIERFFRTVRDGFVNQLPKENITLEELNEKFKLWLRDDYHRQYHQGIRARPLDRYNLSIMNYPRKQIDPDVLNEHFMLATQRKVKKDATISYKGKVFEVPARYSGKTIEIRHVQDDDSEIFIYENDKRVEQITEVDVMANGQNFRPSSVEQVSFTGGKTC